MAICFAFSTIFRVMSSRSGESIHFCLPHSWARIGILEAILGTLMWLRVECVGGGFGGPHLVGLIPFHRSFSL
jgi:hypothetical protein